MIVDELCLLENNTSNDNDGNGQVEHKTKKRKDFDTVDNEITADDVKSEAVECKNP